MESKTRSIVFYCIPIALMIGSIPWVVDDYMLTVVYAACIAGLLSVKSEDHDVLALVFGFAAITVSESFFVSTGVETFTRNSLFGIMPLWLPFLWAYAFLTIKRCLRILDR